MGKLKFTFTNIMFWIGIICSVLVFENITFFTQKDPTEPISLNMEEPYFFILFTIAAVCYLFLIIYETFLNKAKTNVLTLVGCLILLATGITGIMLFGGMSFNNGSPDLVVTQWDKMKHIMTFILFVVSLYCTIFYFTKNHPSIKRLRIVFIGVIAIVYFLVIYSVITEYTKYETIVYAKDESMFIGVNIRSLFLNSNMFACFLLMGICSAIGLNYFKKNVFSFVSMVGFTIIQVFVCSLTCILISFAVVILYLLFEIILLFKAKKKRSMFTLGAMLVIYISTILLFVMTQAFYIEGVSPFFRYLYRELKHSDYSDFSNRLIIWNTSLGASNRSIFTLLFGYGFRNSEYVIGGLMHVDDFRISCHNGYLQYLLNFGVFGLAILAIIFGYYFYCLVRLMKKEPRFALIYSTIGLSYLALACTESIIAFAPSAQGILIGAMFYLPVINKYIHMKRHEVADSVIEIHELPNVLQPNIMVRWASRIIISLMCVTTCFFLFDEFRANTIVYHTLLNAIVILGMLLLSFPYLNGLWTKKNKLNSYLIRASIFAFISAAIAITLLLLYLYGGQVIVDSFKWFAPSIIGITLLTYIIIESVICGGSFKLYLNTFVGFKTSLGSLIGMGAFIAGLYFARGYLDVTAPIMMILVAIAAIVIFYSFTFVIPFKDTVSSSTFISEFDANLMKTDVIRDRLERILA